MIPHTLRKSKTTFFSSRPVVKQGGQSQDHTEFGACSGVQVQVASRGLPLPRPTSLPLELYFQYFLFFHIFVLW